MTQNPQIILKGLHCCSRNNPDCDSCPYLENGVYCRELESDAEEFINSALQTIEDKNCLIDHLIEDIDTKLNYINILEEKLKGCEIHAENKENKSTC